MDTVGQSDMFYQGKLLLATPGMKDFRFEKAVILVCSHNSEGAMGIIVNKLTKDLNFNDILKQLKIDSKPSIKPHEIFFGGPVEYGRGFVVHSSDYSLPESSIQVETSYNLTANIEIIKDIAEGNGPNNSLLALGYAGWGPGQLEKELLLDSWLICDADNDLIFSSDIEKKWDSAMQKIGVTPSYLVTLGGSA